MVKSSELLTLGRIVGVFGIKGWVKVKSYTQPETSIISYQPWLLKTELAPRQLLIADHETSAKGLRVRFEGVQDRTAAEALLRCDIQVEKDCLPKLGEDDFYWYQLTGLTVFHVGSGARVELGRVSRLMETGANDVLVVGPSEQSVDDRERLLPYVYGIYVLRVDLSAKVIEVDWDPEF